jgi:hypothetical protein
MKMLIAYRLLTVTALGLMTSEANSVQVLPPVDDKDLVPTGRDWAERAQPVPGFVTHENNGKGNAPTRGAIGSGINYHGGAVMLGTTNVYYIWYGNWSGNTASSILTDLAHGIGGSPYFDINTTYYTTYFTGLSQHVSNAVSYAGSTNDAYSLGTALSDANIQSIVADKINSGALPKESSQKP